MLKAVLHGTAVLLVWLETGWRRDPLPIDVHASHQSFTTAGVARFNQAYPQGLPVTWGGQGDAEVNGVRYYSWSGTLQPGRTDQGRNRFDASNRFCRLFARTFEREKGQCDGMVGRFSSHLGQVIGDDYPLDHLDIVNQSLGAVGRAPTRCACSPNTLPGSRLRGCNRPAYRCGPAFGQQHARQCQQAAIQVIAGQLLVQHHGGDHCRHHRQQVEEQRGAAGPQAMHGLHPYPWRHHGGEHAGVQHQADVLGIQPGFR